MSESEMPVVDMDLLMGERERLHRNEMPGSMNDS